MIQDDIETIRKYFQIELEEETEDRHNLLYQIFKVLQDCIDMSIGYKIPEDLRSAYHTMIKYLDEIEP